MMTAKGVIINMRTFMNSFNFSTCTAKAILQQ